jgi:hypothetical protein
MCENRIRENIASNFIQVCHVDGELNLADIFTKETSDDNRSVTINV